MTNGTKKAAAFAIIIATLIFAIASLMIARDTSLAEVVAFARSLRQVWWLPFAFVGLYGLFAVACIPTQLLSVAAPIIWGWVFGGTIELIAAILGAVTPYLIARSAFRGAIERRMGDQRIDSFSLLCVFRLVPIIPYPILNYIAGLSVITPTQYVMATTIGMVPSVYIFSYFVDALAAGVMQPSQVFVRVTIAGALLAVFIVVIRLLARVVKPPARAAEKTREDERQAAADPDLR